MLLRITFYRRRVIKLSDTFIFDKSSLYDLVQRFERTDDVAKADGTDGPRTVRTISALDLKASPPVNSPLKFC